MKSVVVVGLFALALPASGIDRRAFTFTSYQLQVRIEPWQQRLAVRGRIALRNDSDTPQRSLALQISSTLNWSSIQFHGKPVTFSSQLYNSDIDHTGALREAIVMLPGPVARNGQVELDVGYEGMISQDATRLTRMGMPPEAAEHSDWDRISKSFSIVRGIGYVAWYPISSDAVLLNEGNTVFEEVGRWKQRETEAEMRVKLCLFSEGPLPTALMNPPNSQPDLSAEESDPSLSSLQCTSHVFAPLGLTVPTFAVANYSKAQKSEVDLYSMPGDERRIENYALAIDETAPVVHGWFGEGRRKERQENQVVELPDAQAAPFQAGSMLLLPASADDTILLLSAVQQLTQAVVSSSRAWILEGVAAYAQAHYLELRKGREAGIQYLKNHRSALVGPQREAEEPRQHALVNANDELFVQTKAMHVWWMLKDMVGENALHSALAAYHASDDRDEHYMESLIEARSGRDLRWFFEDWVYRDRGLPDFHIVSVYPHAQGNGHYLITVTLENSGEAAAEVPVTIRTVAGENSERVTVVGGGKATVRVLAASTPREVVINDGSIPEKGVENPYPIGLSSIDQTVPIAPAMAGRLSDHVRSFEETPLFAN